MGTEKQSDKVEVAGLDYEKEYHRNRKELYELEDENKRLTRAIVILSLALGDK